MNIKWNAQTGRFTRVTPNYPSEIWIKTPKQLRTEIVNVWGWSVEDASNLVRSLQGK